MSRGKFEIRVDEDETGERLIKASRYSRVLFLVIGCSAFVAGLLIGLLLFYRPAMSLGKTARTKPKAAGSGVPNIEHDWHADFAKAQAELDQLKQEMKEVGPRSMPGNFLDVVATLERPEFGGVKWDEESVPDDGTRSAKISKDATIMRIKRAKDGRVQHASLLLLANPKDPEIKRRHDIYIRTLCGELDEELSADEIITIKDIAGESISSRIHYVIQEESSEVVVFHGLTELLTITFRPSTRNLNSR